MTLHHWRNEAIKRGGEAAVVLTGGLLLRMETVAKEGKECAVQCWGRGRRCSLLQ